LDELENADNQEEVVIDEAAVAEALKKLQEHPEPEARFMHTTAGLAPAYNVQTAIDAEHALIVAQQVTTEGTEQRSLLPMAEAAKSALGDPPSLKVIADGGFSNGEQAEACETKGIVPHVPVNRAINNQGDGRMFDRSEFHYEETTNIFRCPAGQTLIRKQIQRDRKSVVYAATAHVCGACPLKARCTNSSQRFIQRHLHDRALQDMERPTTPQVMRLRRSTAEHPFATLKYCIFAHPRFLLRGLGGAQTEIGLAVIAYNLKRMINVLGRAALSRKLATI